jgi:hypothetical protein
MREGDWTETLARWDACLSRFPGRRAPVWHVGRTTALRELGRFAEAEESLRDLVSSSPDELRLQAALARCILDRGAAEGVDRRPEVVALLRAGLLGSEVEENRLVALTHHAARELHGRPPELWRWLRRSRRREGSPCFSAIPSSSRGSRDRASDALLARADRVIGQSDDPEAGAGEAVRLGLWLGSRISSAFARVAEAERRGAVDGHGRMLERVRHRLRLPRREVVNEPKVFGIACPRRDDVAHEALSILGIDAATA